MINTTSLNNKNFYAHNFTFKKDTAEKKTTEKNNKQLNNDPLAKYPLRLFAYSNEVGAALSCLPGGKTAELALWVPALLYFGADIYDKYARGQKGNYDSRSKTKGFEQACFQALASVILPTTAVKIGQGIAASTTKFGRTGLSASAQEEIYNHLHTSLEEGMFKGTDYGKIKKNIISNFEHHIYNTSVDLKTEHFGSKLKRFFGHSNAPVSCANTDKTKVMNFISNKIDDICTMKRAIKLGSIDELSKFGKVKKDYKKYSKEISDQSTLTRKLLNNSIKRKALHRSLLKTAGGFIALALVAVPIDYFVEKFFIKKVIHPGLEKANDLAQEIPLSFKFNASKIESYWQKK